MPDFSSYTLPGVFVEEVAAPVVTPAGVVPTTVALVGDAVGYKTHIETVQLNATTAVQLAQLGIDKTTILVKSSTTGVAYNGPSSFAGAGPWAGTDFEIDQQVGEDATLDTRDDTHTIARVGGSTIADGEFVTVSYQYTDPDYFDLYRFVDYDDVREFYGEPFDSGAVNSPLSLAALLAFRNGASEIFTVAVDTGDFQSAVDLLVDEPRVNVIVPVSGDTADHDIVDAHIQQMEFNGDFRRAFVGLDGTAATVGQTELEQSSSTHDSVRMIVIGPGVFRYRLSSTELVELGGQYLAAAVGGLHAGLLPQEPLTRKSVVRVADIPNQVTDTVLRELGRNGVTMVVQNRRGRVFVRHGVTSKQNPNVYEREISVQAARDRLHSLIQETLDNSSLVGSPYTTGTPDLVMATVQSGLETAKGSVLIRDYGDLKWKTPDGQPTTVEVRFLYQPTLPLNYIQVIFALDTTTGAVGVQSEEEVT